MNSFCEACGENDRAAYGKQLLQFLSDKLTSEFGKGFDVSNLRNMRRFYVTFPIQDALRPELSWTHYRTLMKVNDEAARNFYLEESVKSGWSSRQLDRQINSFYYQRILSSRDKDSVAAEIESLEPGPEYEKIIKDPYVLEFLNLPPNEHYYESELEQALMDHLQKFLLELGRGYSFVARQKHFNVDGRHFYIDLVFYNFILKCFVLIDLNLVLFLIITSKIIATGHYCLVKNVFLSLSGMAFYRQLFRSTLTEIWRRIRFAKQTFSYSNPCAVFTLQNDLPV